MAFKFIHTADLHLDSPLKSLALRDADLAELVGTASRIVLTRIIDLCISEQVQALLIAGDLYDGAQTSMKTARFLAQEMTRLAEADIPVFLIRGNHDAMSRITGELVLPDSVTVFTGRAETIETTWNGQEVAVHGISFRQPHAPDSLLGNFRAPVGGAFNIGLLHTSLGGAAGHDLYAPCSLKDLRDTGFDYWALGHIHLRTAYTGASTVVMPGIPQGRDIGEAGEKSVTMVCVDDAGGVMLSEHVLAVAQFERLEVDCSGLQEWSELVQALRNALTQARRTHRGEHLIVRPVLAGISSLAWRAARDRDMLLQEAQVVAESIGSLWIDKLEVALDEGEGTQHGGPVGELGELIGDTLTGDLDAAVQGELEALIKKLPRELRDLMGDTQEDVTGACRAQMRQGAMELLARLDDGVEV